MKITYNFATPAKYCIIRVYQKALLQQQNYLLQGIPENIF